MDNFGFGEERPVNGSNHDASLYVEFFNKAEKNNYESEQQGRPIFVTIPYIRIVVPGGKTEIVRRAKEFDKTRFPRHWAKFQAGNSQAEGIGTPVEHWGYLSLEQTAGLKAIGIHFVEQIANASDATLQHIGMGARDMKRKASAFIDASQGNATMLEVRKENEDLKEDFESLKRQFIQLTEEHEAIVDQIKKGKKVKLPSTYEEPDKAVV